MAQYEDIQIDQGTDVAIELHLVDKNGDKKDLTGYSLAAKLKKSYNSADSDAVDFDTLVASPSTDGIATLSLNNTKTDAITPGRYVYDVELSFEDSDRNTIIERILEGRVNVTPSVTR